jgi:hypothetical protein
VYDSDLEKDIKNEEDGPIGRVFRSLASGDRPSGKTADNALAKAEAQQLLDVSIQLSFVFLWNFYVIITTGW